MGMCYKLIIIDERNFLMYRDMRSLWIQRSDTEPWVVIVQYVLSSIYREHDFGSLAHNWKTLFT